MDVQGLRVLCEEGESDTVEFKKSTSDLSGIAQTLCAFLNSKGGRLCIGVTPEGKMIGQDVTDRTLQEIAHLVSKFEPPAHIEIRRIPLENNKQVLILTTHSRRDDVPYTWEGRPYQRIGSTTSRLPQPIYEKLLIERNQSNHRWETGIAENYQIEDLDMNEILRTLRLGAENRRIPEYQGGDIGAVLDKLGLIQNARLLNAAVVLFGKKFLPDFPQCQLRLARFPGVDKAQFIDQNQLIGNAFFLLEEALLFIRRHLPVSAKIEPDALERVEEPLFPFEALREALVNAFCHRAYSNAGGAVNVAIFDDRLEIWNDGRLPFGFTPEDLKKDHVSHPRNPLIASVFYDRGLIEKWGRGTQKIVELCVKAGHPEPEFVEQANAFAVRFLPSTYLAPHRISHDLTQRQRLTLQLLSEALSRGQTFAQVKSKLPNPPADRTLRDDFQHLKRLGLVAVRGHGRGAKWNLIPQSHENKAE